MKAILALALVLQLCFYSAEALCPRLRKLMDEMPEDFVEDEEFNSKVSELANNLTASEVWFAEDKEGDEDRREEEDLMILESREKFYELFFGENKSKQRWVIVGCQPQTGGDGSEYFIGMLKLLAAIDKGETRYVCLPLDSQLMKDFEVYYRVWVHPAFEVFEPQPDGTYLSHTKYHYFGDFHSLYYFIHDTQNLRRKMLVQIQEVKPFPHPLVLLAYRIENIGMELYRNGFMAPLFEPLDTTLAPYWHRKPKEDEDGEKKAEADTQDADQQQDAEQATEVEKAEEEQQEDQPQDEEEAALMEYNRQMLLRGNLGEYLDFKGNWEHKYELHEKIHIMLGVLCTILLICYCMLGCFCFCFCRTFCGWTRRKHPDDEEEDEALAAKKNQ